MRAAACRCPDRISAHMRRVWLEAGARHGFPADEE